VEKAGRGKGGLSFLTFLKRGELDVGRDLNEVSTLEGII
jgi:hypothetical protein